MVRSVGGMDITPFRIDIPQSDLDDLRRRLAGTRWPGQLPGDPWERGVPVDELRELAAYWADGYDWRKHEAELNDWPQFTTKVDGQRIHFLHVRSAAPNAVPLLLSHGWPGSVVEFLDVIGPLTDPRSSDPFHLVIPAIPGFGFSGPVSGPGWDSRRIAAAYAKLMAGLGYDRYGAQGGDFGAFIAPDLGRVDPEHVVGVHVNAATVGFIPFDKPDDAELTDAERTRVARRDRYQADGNAYFQVQATRPQTLAYGLTDSPAGQLAWIVEKFRQWTDCVDTPDEAVDRDQLLTNVSVYWLTRTAGSAARLYYEAMHSGPGWGVAPAGEKSSTPTGVAVFPKDISLPLRHLAERSENIVHWSEFGRGG